MVVLGGAKVADKLPVVGSLLQEADLVLIGGAMAFTFLAARGYPVGTSLTEPGLTGTVRGYLDQATRGAAPIVLPADIVVAASRSPGEQHAVAPASRIPAGQMGLDIGPETAAQFATALAGARTIFWNGPMGVTEVPAYADGTRTVARAIIDSGAYSVVGGGDTTAAVRALGFADSAFGYVSTGGGASLEYVQGKTLPGLAVLQDNAAVRA